MVVCPHLLLNDYGCYCQYAKAKGKSYLLNVPTSQHYVWYWQSPLILTTMWYRKEKTLFIGIYLVWRHFDFFSSSSLGNI